MIAISRVFAVVLSLWLVTSTVRAQEFPEITPDTPVDTATLHTWLLSLDPHLIAWAADFARRRHDAQIVSEIPPVLEQWSLPVLVDSYQESSSHRRVVLALLDTLIQENATVPLNVIESVSRQFPAQALILIKRLPAGSTRPTLMTWTFGTDDQIAGRQARAAAMLLSEAPDPEFVARVVRRAEQDLTVELVSTAGMGFGSGGISVGCGDGGGMPPEPRWPAVFVYRLREADAPRASANELAVAQVGSHSITAERRDVNEPTGECSSDLPDATFRHELMAYWLGVSPADMKWQPAESHTIVWTTQAAYESELGTVTEQQRIKMLDSFERLHERDLLEPLPEPRVMVRVDCRIDPCPLQQTQ